MRYSKKALARIERFLALEASSGIILIAVSIAALAWANSPFASLYKDLWHLPLSFSLGSWSFERDLLFWINDGLMTIFFFVVGLEIRREIHQGELSKLSRAALPLLAALGGVMLPALIFLGFNHDRETAGGWGIPMATDIAFAVGVLALLGKRVPQALRVLLLTLAVVDDIGAIIVIALFYSSGLSGTGFVVAGLGLFIIYALQKLDVRSPWGYVLPALVVWGGTYAAGIHPTIAGVVIGMMTPVHQFGMEESPAQVLMRSFHGLVAFFIMPLFALANAGLPIGHANFEEDGFAVFAGVFVGLLVGKPIGIMGLSWLSVRLKIASLPTGVSWSGVTVVGLAGGIGFTMAFFIAQLAFVPGDILETAKLAILCASVVMAVLTFSAGVIFLKR